MIKWVIASAAVVVVAAAGVGFYAGWKTTLRVIDSVNARKKQ